MLVESETGARRALSALDRPGRVLAVDVERKQAVDLMRLALEVVHRATIVPTKPNDATIRSLDVLLTHVLGPELTGLRATVVGTGNLGFKTTLLLCERGATVTVDGRSPEAVARTVAAVGAVLPPFTPTAPTAAGQDGAADLLVTAVSAPAVVGVEWVDRLAPGAVVIDVGIDNVSAAFCGAALDAGIRVLRLDTRAAEAQVLWPAPGFFEGTFGEGVINGVRVVAGGVVGRRGDVVVDDTANPRHVVGVASGSGGLLSDADLDEHFREGARRVHAVLLAR